MKSKLGIEVIDAHAHFMTAESMKAWSQRGRSMTSFEKRTQTRTDMKTHRVSKRRFRCWSKVGQ